MVSIRSSVTARRLAIAAVCVLCMVIAIGLAWWQWERYSSAGGTFQNLGYVLQWPLFGLFPAFMFWRIRRLRRQSRAETAADAAADTGADAEPRATVPAPRPAPAAHDVGNAGDPEDPEDAELAAYNRYLAELNARDHEVNDRW